MAMYENPTHVNWQIVLLGSGMDTRCYRMENPHGLIKTVFEIVDVRDSIFFIPTIAQDSHYF